MNIAIFGSALSDPEQKNITLASHMGREVAKRKHTLVTGGCVGIPSYAIAEAFNNNGETHGYFPVHKEEEIHNLAHIYNNDTSENYTQKIFLRGFSKRSIAMIENVDAVIIINGRMGTLSEFAMAIEEGLPIVVMNGSGGITDHIKEILAMTGRSDYEKIFFTDSATLAIDWIESSQN
ncbi:LOG family protein [Candidatus Nomurabacteria bacterium]|nr:LOG family protein [Candidatus Nomurabacteria bacterium]